MNVSVDYIARRAIAELQDQLRAERRTGQTEAYDALRRETLELRHRVDELQHENAALKAHLIPADPRTASRTAPLALDGMIRHLASELDMHAKAFHWIKARTGNLVAWERDGLRPFCNSVDNRLKFLEMMIEAFVDANPDVRRRFERIHEVIGRVDYSRPDPQPAPAAAKDDAR